MGGEVSIFMAPVASSFSQLLVTTFRRERRLVAGSITPPIGWGEAGGKGCPTSLGGWRLGIPFHEPLLCRAGIPAGRFWGLSSPQ